MGESPGWRTPAGAQRAPLPGGRRPPLQQGCALTRPPVGGHPLPRGEGWALSTELVSATARDARNAAKGWQRYGGEDARVPGRRYGAPGWLFFGEFRQSILDFGRLRKLGVELQGALQMLFGQSPLAHLLISHAEVVLEAGVLR